MNHDIRPMMFEDLDAVVAIERTSQIEPWNRQIIHDCIFVGYLCFVLVKRKRVRGFSISRVKTGVCHLLSLCVDTPYQGKGYGKSLLSHIISHVQADCIKMTLDVRPSNLVANRLYESFGFIHTSVKKGYYTTADGSVEDGVVLTKMLVDGLISH